MINGQICRPHSSDLACFLDSNPSSSTYFCIYSLVTGPHSSTSTVVKVFAVLAGLSNSCIFSRKLSEEVNVKVLHAALAVFSIGKMHIVEEFEFLNIHLHSCYNENV